MNHSVTTEARDFVVPFDCRDCSGPCIGVCPTAAVLRQVDRSVKIAPMKCSGCQLCIVTCPLGILYFDPGNKIARMMEIQFA